MIKRGVYKKCLVCGKEFYVKPSRINQKYCSLACASKRDQRRLPVKKCEFCGKLFHPVHSRDKFCSKECAVKGRRGKTKKNQVPVVCKNCGKRFYRKKSSAKTAKFCSRKCRAEYEVKTGKYKKGNNPNWKGGISYKKSTISSPIKAPEKGKYYERKTREILKKEGYFTFRSGGSRGWADIIAINKERVRLIQVKSGCSSMSRAEKEAFKDINVPSNCSKEIWTFQTARPPFIEYL